MRRTIATLQTLLLSVCAASAAPKPKDDGKPVLYFPSRVGTKWVYDEGRETSFEVSAVEIKADVTIVTVDAIRPKGKSLHEKVSVSAKGVERIQFSNYEPFSYWLLKLPAKVGDSWDFDVAKQSTLRGEKGTKTIGETELIEVPAGKFRAICVETVLKASNRSRTALGMVLLSL
ncbi:MAG TPA: hypothetical protein VHR66_26635 [Gemmataceae bacterium]|nr:hypothetical protein [Gemmataceae bacterium]